MTETRRIDSVGTYYLLRNFDIAESLVEIAREIGRSPAQVALNWITRRPGVVSTLIGATRIEQLDDNLGALEFEIPEEQSRRLEEISRPELLFPYNFFIPAMQSNFRAGVPVPREPPWYRG